jgi:hypothetical protein
MEAVEDIPHDGGKLHFVVSEAGPGCSIKGKE